MTDVQDKTIVTLAEMRSHLNISDDNDTSMDAELIYLLDDICALLSEELSLDQIIDKTYTESYDGDGTTTLFVDHKPIVSVTSLAIDDISAGTENTDYFVYLKEGYIQLYGYKFNGGFKNIDIVYKAGYGAARANVPRPLALALKKWVAAVYKGEIVDYSQRFEEGAYVNLAKGYMPPDVKAILGKYKRVEFGSV